MKFKNFVCRLLTLSTLFLLLTIASASEKYAMIVSLRSGTQELMDNNLNYCKNLKKILLSRGFKKQNISVFFEADSTFLPHSTEATPEKIFHNLKSLKTKIKKDDEFWFFLFGFGNTNRLGLRLATLGARMEGAKLADAINAVPGKHHLFFMNQNNYYFMDLLKEGKAHTIVTAADSEGQRNPPLFPKYLLKVWKNEPKLSLLQSISRTGQLVKHYFESNKMAISETSRIYQEGTVLSYPEYVKDKAVPEEEVNYHLYGFGNNLGKTAARPFLAQKKDFKPATAATKKIIQKAKKAAKEYSAFQAIYLNCEYELTINKDKSTKNITDMSIYLIKDIAAEKFNKIVLSDSPPSNEISDSESRIIAPDGTFMNVTPRVMNFQGTTRRRQLLFKYPGARAGSLIQLKFKTTKKPVNTIPETTMQLELQKSIPILQEKFRLQTPIDNEAFNCKIYGIDEKNKLKVSKSSYSKIRTFTLKNIPAFEKLPFDPPRSECYARAIITSFKSWSDFYEWTQRIMKGSEELDESTEKLAKELTKDAKTPAAKLKEIYEFLCDLRYETTPTGINALRPRNPGAVCSTRFGDCKEKANALVAMAAVIGIKGYRVLVNRGSSTRPDIPSFQFNHMIAYFPELEGFPQGLWCDATDGSTTFGTLPPGDIGREGMILKDDNFEFKKITLSGLSGNMTNSKEYKLLLKKRKDGTFDGTFTLACTGICDYQMRRKLKKSTPLQQQFQIQSIINGIYPGITASQPEISPLHDLSELLTVKCELNANKILTESPGLVPPFNLFSASSMPTRDRALVLNDGQPMTFRQSVTVIGKKGDTKPFNWKGEMACLKIEINRSQIDNVWTDVMEIDILNGVIPPDKYEQFRNVINEMRKALEKLKK